MEEDKYIYVPKALVVACRYPLYKSMIWVLLQLYQLRQNKRTKQLNNDDSSKMQSCEEILVHLLHILHLPSKGERGVELNCIYNDILFNTSHLGKLSLHQYNLTNVFLVS